MPSNFSTTASAVYSSPITLSATGTLKFFAVDVAGNVETVKSQLYVLGPADSTAPVTTATPAGGLFNAAQNVTLAANEASTIRYTLDGSTPTTASTIYSSPIAISSTTTLKFFATDAAGNVETVRTENYYIAVADSWVHTFALEEARYFENGHAGQPAVWTGGDGSQSWHKKFIVWGGFSSASSLGTGFMLDESGVFVKAIADAGAPAAWRPHSPLDRVEDDSLGGI
ncbi:MAG: chitobiase/beta-hexosaminidase C-terminal domain-containing protein [Planctomycetes bacterium]|nr:chitobiase/beta-hexosaminidase C-terminal domain-containing protein [Planctomycetota bacterium]